MAVNFYCGTRYTEDVDAFYTRRVHVGPCEVSYLHRDGSPSFLNLDNNYNPTFGLLHEMESHCRSLSRSRHTDIGGLG
jgi:hypothetical protein